MLEGRLLLEVSTPPPARNHTPVTSCGVVVCPYHGSSRDMLQDSPGHSTRPSRWYVGNDADLSPSTSDPSVSHSAVSAVVVGGRT